MKWTVFLVEGQTEQVFLQWFVEKLVSLQRYHLELQKLSAGNLLRVSSRGVPQEQCSNLVQIVNVQGDDTVNSYIAESMDRFKSRGVHAVYGLRDQFTGSNSKAKVDIDRVDQWTQALTSEVGVEVQITIAIEEVEAWFLSVPSFFVSYDRSLTSEVVNQIAGVDLDVDDVQKIEHPSALIRKILQSVGQDYRKRLDDSHKIASTLDYDKLYLEKSAQFPPLGRLVSQLSNALT